MASQTIRKDNMSEADRQLIQKIDDESAERRKANRESREIAEQQRRKEEAEKAKYNKLCDNVESIMKMQAQQNEILMSLVVQIASGSRVEIPRSLVRTVYQQYTESAS